MSSGAKISLVILAVLVVGGAAYLAMNSKSSDTPSATSSTVSPSSQVATPPAVTNTASPAPATTPPAVTAPSSTSSSTTAATAATTITYKNGVFSPASASVAVGGSVVFSNTGTTSVTIDSDPHPSHTDYPPLNLGIVAAGKTSSTVSFTKAGTYGYHNHANSSETGTIVVK